MTGYCGGQKKQGEGTCTQAAGWGTSHPGTGKCKLHGGSTPNHEAAARLEAARAAVSRHALDVDISPEEALLQGVRRAQGRVVWLRARVEELDPGAIVWGTRSLKHTSGHSGDHDTNITVTEEAAGVHYWWQLYMDAEKVLASVSRDAIAAGATARMLGAIEREAEAAGAVALGIADELGLTGADRDRALDAAERRFVLLTGGLSA